MIKEVEITFPSKFLTETLNQLPNIEIICDVQNLDELPAFHEINYKQHTQRKIDIERMRRSWHCETVQYCENYFVHTFTPPKANLDEFLEVITDS